MSGINQTNAPNLHLAWQASDTAPNHGVFSQPIVSNGLVYWGSFDGYERATDHLRKSRVEDEPGHNEPSGLHRPF